MIFVFISFAIIECCMKPTSLYVERWTEISCGYSREFEFIFHKLLVNYFPPRKDNVRNNHLLW